MMAVKALRERRLGLALAALVLGSLGTVATALPLAVLSTAGLRTPVVLIDAHIAFAVVALSALLIKLALLGKRARPARARMFFASLIAHAALALVAYATLTGILVLADPQWSNQHLAASFWALVLAGAHIRHRRRRTAALLQAAVPRNLRSPVPVEAPLPPVTA
jgi:hypothetical protein